MRLTLESTEPLRYPTQRRRPRVTIEIADDDPPFSLVLEDLVVPALLAAGYPVSLVEALGCHEAVTLRGPLPPPEADEPDDHD